MKYRRFMCEYCETGFAQEARYLKHKCEQMKRHEDFHTVQGTAAWNFYQDWLKAQRRRVPNSDTFLHSRQYNAFMRFAAFVQKVRLPSPSKFIKFAVKKDFLPAMWPSDSVYGMYLENIDHQGDPWDQVLITVKTVEELSEEYQCDSSEIFEVVPPSIIIHLLRLRRLTPWILLQSRKFGEFLHRLQQDSTEEYVIMNAIIRPEFWKKKFTASRARAIRFKDFVSALGL